MDDQKPRKLVIYGIIAFVVAAPIILILLYVMPFYFTWQGSFEGTIVGKIESY